MTFVHETAVVGEGVTIGRGSYVGPHVSIEGRVRIGARCRIEAGARIGQRGFGYEFVENPEWPYDSIWLEKPHNYGVVLDDHVHIGANTCIDRGSWRDTRVGHDTVIDNLVHIAHNVDVGPNCCIVAQAELSGSVQLSARVYVGPGAKIRERLFVGTGSIVGIGAVVVKNVDAGVVVAGVPARVFGPVTEWPPPPPPDA